MPWLASTRSPSQGAAASDTLCPLLSASHGVHVAMPQTTIANYAAAIRQHPQGCRGEGGASRVGRSVVRPAKDLLRAALPSQLASSRVVFATLAMQRRQYSSTSQYTVVQCVA